MNSYIRILPRALCALAMKLFPSSRGAKRRGDLVFSAFILTLILCITVGCTEESEPRKVDTSVSLTLKDGQWLYYSIADSTVLGYSTIGDLDEDAEWAERKDWDVALSEYGVRTNSGTSGRGSGGIRVSDTTLWMVDTLAIKVSTHIP